MRLPSFQELSKEQDVIYTLSLDGNHLVTGPPGTGKTVMALYRAQALAIDDRPTKILMYSRALKSYTSRAAEEIQVEGSVETFHSWMWRFWRQQYGEDPPRRGDDRWAFDWRAVTSRFATAMPAPDTLMDLLVDEGQDLSPHFFQIVRMMARNITAFADENQQLHDDNSTLKEIRRALGRDTEVHALTRNYRNTRQIASLAERFYCGSPTGLPERPRREGDPPLLSRHESLSEFIEALARYERSHSDSSIGVVAPGRKSQMNIYNRLSGKETRNKVQTYVSGGADLPELDFDAPGVIVLNPWTIKGLEFDTVFVPELQQVSEDATSAGVRMRYYVVFSRAREELRISYSGEGPEPPLIADIPDDILERV